VAAHPGKSFLPSTHFDGWRLIGDLTGERFILYCILNVEARLDHAAKSLLPSYALARASCETE